MTHCCTLDHDGDGNCPIHSAPGVLRHEESGTRRSARTAVLRDYGRMFNENAVEKGFVVPGHPRSMDRIVSLLHSEISEAYEQFRDGRPTLYVFGPAGEAIELGPSLSVDDLMRVAGGRKFEGVAAEFADLFIRLLQSSEELGVDLASAVEAKHLYNRTRPHMHGGKLT